MVFKRFSLLSVNPPRFRLISYNPLYPPTDLSESDFEWIYPVAAVMKETL